MKERPILFAGRLVRAILEGRKTQTRRVIRPDWWRCLDPEDAEDRASALTQCPYGQPGDTLWVRETCWLDREPVAAGEPLRAFFGDGWCRFADGSRDGTAPFPMTEARLDSNRSLRKTPSIHMPRWASRLTLRVTGVRVERLQEISEADAIAEGLAKLTKDGGRTWKYGVPDRDGLPGNDDEGWHWSEWEVDPRKAFAKSWDSINGKRAPWASNPWVLGVEFERHKATEQPK